MKTAIIIHGMPTKESYYDLNTDSQSSSHWLPWLQQELLRKDILAQTPKMPIPYDPVYSDWKKMFERFDLNEETILVGHSCGGGFILRYLSEENIHVDKVVLVAPWVDPDRYLNTGMFDFTLDRKLATKTKGLTIFESTNDIDEVQKSINIIKDSVNNIKIITFKNYGHFCLSDMNTEKFPELLKECLE